MISCCASRLLACSCRGCNWIQRTGHRTRLAACLLNGEWNPSSSGSPLHPVGRMRRLDFWRWKTNDKTHTRLDVNAHETPQPDCERSTRVKIAIRVCVRNAHSHTRTRAQSTFLTQFKSPIQFSYFEFTIEKHLHFLFLLTLASFVCCSLIEIGFEVELEPVACACCFWARDSRVARRELDCFRAARREPRIENPLSWESSREWIWMRI